MCVKFFAWKDLSKIPGVCIIPPPRLLHVPLPRTPILLTYVHLIGSASDQNDEMLCRFTIPDDACSGTKVTPSALSLEFSFTPSCFSCNKAKLRN